jgi:hypothetical protein
MSTREPGSAGAFVTELGTDATIAVRRRVRAGQAVPAAKSELGLELLDRLREAGIPAATD